MRAQAEVATRYRELQADGEKKQHALWFLKETGAREERAKKAQEMAQAQNELEAAIAGLRAGEAALESRRQAHYAASDAVHAAQGGLYEANAQVSRLEAEIRHVVDSRNRLQSRRDQLQQQIAEWTSQREHCTEQIAQAEDDLATAAARTEEARATAEDAQAGLPSVEQRVREAAAGRDEMRAALARVEQNLALVAQTQRDADRQMQVLEQRRERLQQELRELHAPDPVRLEQLAGDRLAGEDQLEEAQEELATLEGRVPEADAERSRAQAAAQTDVQNLARLEARLSALVKLQEDVQKQGALEPWLAKHELAGLSRLWQKLHVEPGWETALESALRERMASLEVRSLDWARAFAEDAPPARLAFYQLPVAAPTPPAPAGLTPLASLLRITDPDLRTLLNDWLAGIYTATDVTQALAMRATLPAGSACVVKAGHLIDAHSVRFYAPDSEQAGLLARQQEIENLQREIKGPATDRRPGARRGRPRRSGVAAGVPGDRSGAHTRGRGHAPGARHPAGTLAAAAAG